jgi:hypothetical protein
MDENENTKKAITREGTKRKKRTPRSKSKGPTSKKPMGSRISAEQLPRKTLEQALRIPKALRETYAGGSASWQEIAKASGLSLSQPNKYYLWAAQAYNLVEKEGDKFLLTETGRKIVAPMRPNEDKEAIVKAILSPVALSRFFTDYNGSPFPADEHMGNILEDRYSIPRDRAEEAKTLIKQNGLYSGILQEAPDGSLSVRLDPTMTTPRPPEPTEVVPVVGPEPISVGEKPSAGDFSKMCFIVAPIGEDESPERKHASMVLKSVIEPVVSEFGLVAKRADQIERSGIITQQIFECLAKSKLCIADLSFNNPNAFYELGIRHMCKLPTIQIIRKGDKIPFDVSQGRTIRMDFTDIYTVVESIESAKKELKQHVKHALSGEYKGEDNPVNVYLPGIEIKLPK